MRNQARTLGGYWHLLDQSEAQLIDLLLGALNADTVQDWNNARKTAEWGLAEGRKTPLALEERQAPSRGNGQAHKAAPPPSAQATPTPITVWDPWEDPPPPEWPAGILSRETENTLASVSLRDGVDFGVLCMAVIAAASAAAPHNARFAPYVGGHWQVPPIIWCMLIGESGLRKTLLDAVAFAPIRAQESEAWSFYQSELAAWRRADKGERGDKPEPRSFICNDCMVRQLPGR